MSKRVPIILLAALLPLVAGCSGFLSGEPSGAPMDTSIKVQYTAGPNASGDVANLLATPTPEPTPPPNVEDAPYYPVDTVLFAIHTYNVPTNSTVNLPGLTVGPSWATNRYVSITSNDTSVVYFDRNDWMLHTGRYGSAVITATALSGVSDSCIVIVSVAQQPVTSILFVAPFSSTSPAGMAVGETRNCYITVRPSGATDFTINWTTSDLGIVQILYSNNASCALRGNSPGTAIITATSDNGTTASTIVHVTAN